MESVDQLLAGELDLAVRSREALPHGLRFEPLFASDRMLIVPRGHELAGKERPTLSRWRIDARVSGNTSHAPSRCDARHLEWCLEWKTRAARDVEGVFQLTHQ